MTASDDDIAIVGMACRFPAGISSPHEFWDFLRAKGDAITEIPADRWSVSAFYHPDPARPGKTYARHGGFLRDVMRFDAEFFGMSPREAARADPQQRLLLEVAWEALEDAGLRTDELSGAAVGTYIGISSFDYAGMQWAMRRDITAHTSVGSALSIAANRLAYQFDLRGPSLAVDTACSSSLVACHLACESLRRGETEMALVGGVGVILRPEGFISFSKASMLSPDGHCKAFDARANGFVRAEGAGVVVLKPLRRARADGDLVYAVIRGTHLNQDGRTTGIALPNPEAQEQMLREAYYKAGVSPRDVQYIEAHGTGTAAGDPIEVGALARVIGSGRGPDELCRLGSVKSNLGHLEAASGMAGLIKAALALHRGEIPPNIHFESPNPQISFGSNGLRVVRELEPWATNCKPRVAAVNSFGFGGTNAHVILQEGPVEAAAAPPRPVSSVGGAELFVLSGRNERAVRALAGKYAAWLRGPGADADLRSLCSNASQRRSHHQVRMAVAVHHRDELIDRVEAFAREETRPRLSLGRAFHKASKSAWVCTGMGPQWWGMGRTLFENEPVYREALSECSDALARHAQWSLVDELIHATDSASRVQDTAIAQPAIFATQVALAALLRSWGVEPEAIVGHSVGEVAAAHIAGALDLEDAVRVIYHRSRLQARLAGTGRMLAVALSADAVAPLLAGREREIAIAAINSPESVTLAGDAGALEAVAAELNARQAFARFLQVEVPYHCHRMDAIEAELKQSLAGLRPRATRIPLVSSVTGAVIAGAELGAEYWWRNVRQPVLFGAAVKQLLDEDYSVFLEVGPHPVLNAALAECFPRDRPATSVATLRRQEPEGASVRAAVGALYCAGASIDWSRLYPDASPRLRLPTYAWQGEEHVYEPESVRRDRLGLTGHPLLGRRLETQLPIWQREIDPHQTAYLADHAVQGSVVFPAAGYVEIALAAAAEVWGPGPCSIENLVLERALFLPGTDVVVMQTTLDSATGELVVSTRSPDDEQRWTQHVRAVVHRVNGKVPAATLAAAAADAQAAVASDRIYPLLASLGLDYGPAFQGISRLFLGDGEARGEVRATLPSADVAGYVAHPSMLDACFQVFVGTLLAPSVTARSGAQHARGVYLPVRIARIAFHAPLPEQLTVRARLQRRDARRIVGRLELIDAQGALVASFEDFECRAVDILNTSTAVAFYEYQWQLQPRSPAAAAEPLAPTTPQLAAHLDEVLDAFRERLEGERAYRSLAPRLTQLAIAYVNAALIELGWNDLPEGPASTPELAERLGVVPEHHRQLGCLLDLMAQHACVARAERGFWAAPLAAGADAAALWRELWSDFPIAQAEAILVRRCGENLAKVLRGDVDPLQLLFPDGSSSVAEHLYQDSPSNRIYNTLVQKAVARIARSLPAGRPLRVLELGGGTGGLTSYVLPVLPRDSTHYVFTDLGQSLVAEAKRRFSEFPFVEYRALDIDKDPAEQGIEPHSFDLVLASDVLHAVRDLRGALRNVQQLLAPGGQLMMIELTNVPIQISLIFGLLKGWWAFTDLDVRPTDPWLSGPRWRALLVEENFPEVAVVTDTDDPEIALHSVVIARSGASHAPLAGARPEASTADARRVRPDAPVLLLADQGGVAEQVADELERRGERAVLVRPVLDSNAEHLSFSVRLDGAEVLRGGLAEVLGQWPSYRGIVHLLSLDAGELTSLEAFHRSTQLGSLALIELARVIMERDVQVEQLTVVTGGVHAVQTTDTSLATAQAPIYGTTRVMINELPQLRFRLVDLSARPSREEAAALARELVESEPAASQEAPFEDTVALRGAGRYVSRLERVAPGRALGLPQKVVDAPEAFRIEQSLPGSVDHLELTHLPRPAPGPGQVEIEVFASGLNFKDVMYVLGAIPEDHVPATGYPMGLECAGRIARVGAGVTEFAEGDAVMAIAGHLLRTHVVTEVGRVRRMPKGMTFEEAATFQIAMLTGWHALKNLASLRRGERVLIHAGAGGVGLAAIQIAKHLGAEVFATAGSPLKREVLRGIGVPHVMDSRTLGFADEVLEKTGGEGVDVVLNSLAGEALLKSVGLLRLWGRFVEIGVRDIYENTRLGLLPFRKNLSFMSTELSPMAMDRPWLLQEMLDELVPLYEQGKLKPLSYRAFPAARVAPAFRYMARGKHLGKVVISFSDRDGAVPARTSQALQIQADASYLITGGVGGLGLEFARGLVQRGARHLVLLSRSGAPLPEAQQKIDELVAAGVEVRVRACDVSDETSLRAVFDECARAMPPIRGIVHGAMVLDDGLVNQLSPERFMTALAPKLLGAWNLDRLSAGLPLDFFLMFSSVTSIVGNPGQANYAAGNSYLDALAAARRLRGLPALTVNLGAIAGGGFVARTEGMLQRVHKLGLLTTDVTEMVRVLLELLELPHLTQICAAALDWAVITRNSPSRIPARFAQFDARQSDEEVSQDAFDLVAVVKGRPAAEAQALIFSRLRQRLSAVLGTAAEAIDIDVPIIKLGLDSLMALELKNGIRSETGVEVPAVKLLEGLSLRGVGDFLLRELTGAIAHETSPAAVDPAAGQAPADLALEQVDQLSDEDVDRYLQQLAGPAQGGARRDARSAAQPEPAPIPAGE